MNHESKVVWSEGMFLRPQHFQQQERYLESRVHQCLTASTGFLWGFGALEIDAAALARGTVMVRLASGVLRDGTPFALGSALSRPLAFDFPPTARDAKVCLVLPPPQEGAANVIYDEDAASGARFRVATHEAGDDNEQGAAAAEIQVCEPRFRLMLEASIPAGGIALGMVKVIERQPNDALRLSEEYIPPTLRCKGLGILSNFTQELTNLLGQRGEALSRRLSEGGRGGVSEVGDFLLLTLINRWQSLVAHLGQIEVLHPERLYSHLLCLAGELSSFSAERRRTLSATGYIHDDLWGTFQPLMADLRRALALVLDQTVIRIALQEHKYGIRLAIVSDRSLLKQASFVLAVQANLPAEQIQAQFPAQVKIGPVEKIRDLVNLQLPGVGLRLLPVAPRELPYNAGYNYFEIDTRHELWRDIEKSSNVALHVAGNFPGLALE